LLAKRETHEVRKARYLNSSEAERRTNKASGDKYSTSLGKLRQSRGLWAPLVLLRATLVRHYSLWTSRLSRRLDGKQFVRTREREILDLQRDVSYVARGSFTGKWHAIEWQVFKSRARGTAQLGAKSRSDRSWWWKTTRGRRQESRQDYRGTTQSARELSTVCGEGLTIAKTCPNSGIREIRWWMQVFSRRPVIVLSLLTTDTAKRSTSLIAPRGSDTLLNFENTRARPASFLSRHRQSKCLSRAAAAARWWSTIVEIVLYHSRTGR